MPSNPHQTYELMRPVYPLPPPASSSGGTGCSENKMLMKPINKKQGQNQPPHFTSLPLFLALQKLNLKLKPNSKTNEQGHFYPQPTFQNIYNPKQNHQTENKLKKRNKKRKRQDQKIRLFFIFSHTKFKSSNFSCQDLEGNFLLNK